MESSQLFSTLPPVPSHVLGLKQIGAIWISPNINPSVVSIALHHFGVGDHRCIIIDIPMETFFGSRFIPVCYPKMRRLTMKKPEAVKKLS